MTPIGAKGAADAPPTPPGIPGQLRQTLRLAASAPSNLRYFEVTDPIKRISRCTRLRCMLTPSARIAEAQRSMRGATAARLPADRAFDTNKVK